MFSIDILNKVIISVIIHAPFSFGMGLYKKVLISFLTPYCCTKLSRRVI
jgi:hypothetical protein